jgi:hypothetical protein
MSFTSPLLWPIINATAMPTIDGRSEYVSGTYPAQRVLGPLDLSTVQAPDFIATKTDLLLRYTTRAWGIALYRLGSGNAFTVAEAAFLAPSDTDHSNSWWRASNRGDGVAFADRRAWPF